MTSIGPVIGESCAHLLEGAFIITAVLDGKTADIVAPPPSVTLRGRAHGTP